MEEKFLNLLVRQVMVRFGGGVSYKTAIAQVARKKRLQPKDVTELAVAVYKRARIRKQITRKQARALIEQTT